MSFSEPLDGLRDFVTWPVLPVTPPLPLRTVKDLEPFTPEPMEPDESQSTSQDSIDLSVRSRGPSVADLMRDDVVTIGPEQTVGELEDLLVRHRISGVPVTEDGVLLGVVSQTDLVRHHCDLEKRAPLPVGGYHHQGILFDPSQPAGFPESSALVREIMTPYSFYATESATILEVLDLMLHNHIHRVVITRDRHLVGVITSTDILHHYRRTLSGA